MRRRQVERAMTTQVHRFRLVATDLDGTLLRGDGTISPRTHAILREIRERGIALALVTARPPRVVRAIAAQVDVTGLAICCNGALVYDLDGAAIVWHAPLAPEVARCVVAALRAVAPGVCFAVERGLHSFCEPAWLTLSPTLQEDVTAQGDALALCAEPVTKLLVQHPDYPLEHLLTLTRSAGGDAITVTCSGAPFVEVSATGVHKAAALADLCGAMRIPPAAVVAFGDMPNDLPMLRWAGRGVAVANAHPEVLQAASAVTASNEQDGVADELARLFGVVAAQ